MLKFRSEIDALNSQGMDIDSFEADMKSFLGYLVEINKNKTPHNKLSRDKDNNFGPINWSCNIL